MAIKIVSTTLLRGMNKKEVLENEKRLVDLETKTNSFLEANQNYKKIEVLQSSGGASQFGVFTTITFVLSNS